MGGSARIAGMFNYPTVHIDNYYDNPGNKIVLFLRQSYLTDKNIPELPFIETYYDRIIGVIITDDKANGPTFGEKKGAMKRIGLPIISVIDRVCTQENKMEIERWLTRHAK